MPGHGFVGLLTSLKAARLGVRVPQRHGRDVDGAPVPARDVPGSARLPSRAGVRRRGAVARVQAWRSGRRPSRATRRCSTDTSGLIEATRLAGREQEAFESVLAGNGVRDTSFDAGGVSSGATGSSPHSAPTGRPGGSRANTRASRDRTALRCRPRTVGATARAAWRKRVALRQADDA